jgi:hypothetical protein
VVADPDEQECVALLPELDALLARAQEDAQEG